MKCKLTLQPVVSDLEVSPSLNNYLKDVKMQWRSSKGSEKKDECKLW